MNTDLCVLGAQIPRMGRIDLPMGLLLLLCLLHGADLLLGQGHALAVPRLFIDFLWVNAQSTWMGLPFQVRA